MSSTVQIRARFVTEHAEYRISDAPFAIPAKLGRSGLSEVVNHLLGNESDASTPFDFCIRDVLVRVPLSRFLAANSISTEEIIQIEYMPASTLSDEKQTIDAPAWVGAMDCSTTGFVLAGCYDGSVEILDAESKQVAQKLQAHVDPVRSVVSWVPDVDAAHGTADAAAAFCFASASKDQSVKCWQVTRGTEAAAKGRGKKATEAKKAEVSVTLLATLNGHTNSVESLDYWSSRSMLLTGDWAGNIMGWNAKKLSTDGDSGMDEDDSDMETEMGSGTGSRKRQKKNAGKAGKAPTFSSTPTAVFTLKAHSQSVSALQAADDTRVFTSSWDHALKIWDMDRQDVVAVYTSGSKICTSLHYNDQTHLVGTSHSDGRIRLWDCRQNQSSDSASSCQSIVNGGANAVTPQWVSQVRWHPTKPMVFGCTDYAGALRVWDIRSTKVPLGNSDTHDGKALCLDWAGTTVFSGGSDCVVQATVFD